MWICATDVRFHRALVDAAHNDLLSFLMTAVVEALQPVSNLITFRMRDRRRIIGHHQAIGPSLRSEMETAPPQCWPNNPLM